MLGAPWWSLTCCLLLRPAGGSNPSSEPTSPRSSYGWGLPDVPSMGEQHTEDGTEAPGSPTRSGGSFSSRKGVSNLARAVTGEGWLVQLSWLLPGQYSCAWCGCPCGHALL